MEGDALQRLTENLGSGYLSLLKDPKLKDRMSRMIILEDAPRDILVSLRDSLKKYFSDRDENVAVLLREEAVHLNHDYFIDVGFFLGNPPLF